MRLHRFIVDGPLTRGSLDVADAGLRNQLANVLRLMPGDAVTLCDGKGTEAAAAIVSFGKASVAFAIDGVAKNAAESAVRVTLYCAPLKRENFELVCQKATEAGVARIVPVVTRRTVKTGFRADRVAKIVKEAAEQSGRGTLPVVADALDLADAFADAAALDANVFFELGGAAFSPSSLPAPSSVGVWTGPEGGWDAAETAEAREKGFAIATLGPRTLRAETAAIVAVWLAASRGDTAL